MDTKMHDMGSNKAQPHSYPGADPPPYPGPPAGASYQAQSEYPAPPAGSSYQAQSGYPAHAGYPVTNQPHILVHPTTTVIHGSSVIPAVIVTNGMAPGPTHYVCRSCNQQIITRVERIPSMRTHLCAAILCILGLWPCVCIPYCVDSCNNAEHYCPNCNAYIGSYAG